MCNQYVQINPVCNQVLPVLNVLFQLIIYIVRNTTVLVAQVRKSLW